jgi:AcrR family transcriptional regulator
MVRNWYQRNGITLIVKPVTSMATVSPIGENRDRRTIILDAALGVFTQKGFHAASVDDVASAAGVSKPIVYQYFTSKHALYLGLLDRSVGETFDGVANAIASQSLPHLRVEAAIAYYFDAVDLADLGFRLIFESDFTSDSEVKERLEQFLFLVTRTIGTEISEATGLSVGEANVLAAGITGMAQKAAWRWIQLGRPNSKEKAVEQITQLAWHGLSAFPAEKDN